MASDAKKWAELIDKETIDIIVKPNSPKTEIKSFDSDKQAYRVDVKAHPEKGEANKEIVKYFIKILKKEVRIISGLKSRRKVLRIG
ncbi:MAG: YggU family protein [Gammaproteobacteria bacterium]|nr:YggU family protein [Gammaproteobacteria bacterium]